MAFTRYLLVVSSLCIAVIAQTQGSIPQITDVYSDDSPAQSTVGTIVMGENVVTGDKLIAVVQTPGSGFMLTDTLSNSWTCTTPVATPTFPAFTRNLYFCYADASSSGPDTITACPTNDCRLAVMRGVHLGALDGSAVNQTNSVSGLSSFSSTVTTTVNGSLIVTGVINDNDGTTFIRGSYLSGAATSSSAPFTQTIQTHTTALGSYVITADADSPAAFGAWPTQAMQSIAFKPAAITLTDTVMPDASAGVAYSAQLHGIGGIAGLTYACTGLPAHGLALNTATGAITGATPTAATLSLSCTVTDGTTTSSPAALTLLISAGGFNTPNVKLSGNANDSGNTTIAGVNCGDEIVIFARGDATHNTTGFLQKWNGTSNKVFDSLGSPVQRYVGPWGGVMTAPIVAYIIGPVSTSGPDTISVNNNQNASSNQQISPYFVVSGVQNVVDSGATTNIMTSTNTSSIAATYTTPVVNELLLGAIVGQGRDPISGGGTPSMGAPFASLSIGIDTIGVSTYGYYLSPTATSVTLTNSVTGQGTQDVSWTTMLIPLRPALPLSTCAIPAGAEKVRRQVF